VEGVLTAPIRNPQAAQPLGMVSSYEDLLMIMRAQVPALGINYGILDGRAGFTETYTTKILGSGGITRTRDQNGKLRRSTQRGLSPQAFDAFLEVLCIDLVAVQNPERVAKLKAWLEQHGEARKRNVNMPPIGSMPRATWLITPKKSIWLNKRRNEKLTPERRSEISRNAAKKRWSKPKVVDITEQRCVAEPDASVTVDGCQSDQHHNSSLPENGK
jgi:hypothetical protein